MEQRYNKMLNQLNHIQKDSLVKLVQARVMRVVSRVKTFVTKQCGHDLEKVQMDAEFFITSSKVKNTENTKNFKIPHSQYKFYFASLYLIIYGALLVISYFIFSFDLSIYKNMTMLSNKKAQVLKQMSKMHQLGVFNAVQILINPEFKVSENFYETLTATLTNTSFEAFTQQSNAFGYSNDIEEFLKLEATMNICLLKGMIEYSLIDSKCKEVEGQLNDFLVFMDSLEFNNFWENLRGAPTQEEDQKLLSDKLKESKAKANNMSYYLSPQSLLTSTKSLILTIYQTAKSGLGLKLLLTPAFPMLQQAMIHASQYLLFLSHYHDIFVVELLDCRNASNQRSSSQKICCMLHNCPGHRSGFLGSHCLGRPVLRQENDNNSHANEVVR